MEIVNIAEFRKNLKSYIEQACITGHTVIVSSVKEKQVAVISLDYFNKLKKLENMNNITINYADNFKYNELLHQTSKELAGTYARLAFNHKTHSEVENWKLKSKQWRSYNSDIKDLFIKTEDLAEKEVERLSVECKAILKLEEVLNKKLDTKHLSIA